MRIIHLADKAFINKDLIVNNHIINELKDNSKSVKENDVFFAIKGNKDNGINYINDAINNGAKTIVYEDEIIKDTHGINYIKVENIKRILALFCKFFYKDITRKIKMVGITGTNGKTTVSTMLYDFISYSGIDAVLIGTNGVFFQEEHYHATNTTPSILKTYDIITETVKKGVKYVIMEVSSIGIREARVLYFDFDIIIFTNLTHDHLDYHKNITDYKFSKGLLLWDVPIKKDKVVILNGDDPAFSFLSSLTKGQLLSYGIYNDVNYKAYNIEKNIYTTHFKICIRENIYNVKSSLVGGFNVYNILSLFAAIDFLNFDILSFVDFLKLYVMINGRMNKIHFKNRTVIIDFAHTPTSVINVLQTLKEFSNNKITVVIGCGGNRDVLKRNQIAKISLNYADKVIFTTDNPRNEEPQKIIDDMVYDLPKNKYEIVIDRKEAIIKVLEESVTDEVIAILGKGCEREQIIKNIRYPFSDKEVVYNWLKNNND